MYVVSSKFFTSRANIATYLNYKLTFNHLLMSALLESKWKNLIIGIMLIGSINSIKKLYLDYLVEVFLHSYFSSNFINSK